MADTRYWLTAHPSDGETLVRTLRDIEDRGAEGVWIPQTFDPPFTTLGAAAVATSRLKLGSGIALAFTRTPLETALSALTLDRLSGGRLALGLGTSTRYVNEAFHGVPYGDPIAKMRDVVGLVRTIIERAHTGELAEIQGAGYRMDLRALSSPPPVRRTIPIFLSPLFERTIELAAEVGDGIVGHPVWTPRWVTEVVAPQIKASLAKRGRARDRFEMNLWVYCLIHADRQKALADARSVIAFYAGIGQYKKYFAAHGFEKEAVAIAEATARGDIAGAVAATPNEMGTTFAAAGSPDEVRGWVAKIAAVADSVTLVAPHTVDPASAAEYRRAIADAFLR
jgi:alkanesulfonate monooxygenase SsuD/methylene tetrahydromethanopterin reductase-like flavin-dependent oxidoreductase (luciferase family)